MGLGARGPAPAAVLGLYQSRLELLYHSRSRAVGRCLWWTGYGGGPLGGRGGGRFGSAGGRRRGGRRRSGGRPAFLRRLDLVRDRGLGVGGVGPARLAPHDGPLRSKGASGRRAGRPFLVQARERAEVAHRSTARGAAAQIEQNQHRRYDGCLLPDRDPSGGRGWVVDAQTAARPIPRTGACQTKGRIDRVPRIGRPRAPLVQSVRLDGRGAVQDRAGARLR